MIINYSVLFWIGSCSRKGTLIEKLMKFKLKVLYQCYFLVLIIVLWLCQMLTEEAEDIQEFSVLSVQYFYKSKFQNKKNFSRAWKNYIYIVTENRLENLLLGVQRVGKKIDLYRQQKGTFWMMKMLYYHDCVDSHITISCQNSLNW